MRISDWSSDVCSSDLKLSYTFQGDVGSSREFAFATGGSPFTLKGVDPKGFGSIDGGISALFKERSGVFVQGGLNFGGSQKGAEARGGMNVGRSEERQVGKEGVRKCRSRWRPSTE